MPHSLRLDPPLPVAGLNRLLAPLGPGAIDVGFEAAAAASERIARLDDWGTDAQRGRFERLCALNAHNPNLTPWGRVATRIFLHWKMVNHLRRIEAVRRDPAVRDVRLPPPIVVVGFYRTGTTTLHGHLALDPALRAPRTYELAFPVPFAEDDRLDRALRRATTAALLEANRAVVPEQANAHFIEVDGPEECFFLFENAGVSTTHVNTFEAYDYAYELLRSDLSGLYRDHRLQLQLLARNDPSPRPFVLKCPFHLWTLDALLDEYPDARLVFTHRDVKASLASNCSLSAMTTSKFVARFDPVRHGAFWLGYYEEGMRRGLAARDARAPTCADVRLPDLARDPVGTLRQLYDALDLPFTDAHATRVRAAVTGSRAGGSSRGAHGYSLAQFGLDDATVDARFAAYHTRFGLGRG